jgi:hypothetical protein
VADDREEGFWQPSRGRGVEGHRAARHLERPRSAGPEMVAEAAASHKRSLSETARTVKIDPRRGDAVD